jgi:uncharacterized membrane protein YphA (DoxX/SURF4 family)
MKKILLVVLLLACFYAFHFFALGNAGIDQEKILTETEQDNKTRASFTGGILIVAAVGAGYLVKKIYAIRSASDQ